MPPRSSRRVLRFFFYLLVASFGVVATYWPTLRSGFASMQAERGDTLHINYVLEHQLTQLWQPGKPGTYWSPAYFHPQPDGLAYSENLIGTLPIYAALRTALPPHTAFQVWGMAILFANFAAMTWSLRRLGVRPILAAAGGFVFAFGLTRAAHLNHQHLLPHFGAPIAVWASIRWMEQPRLRYWAAAVCATGSQLLLSLHHGWFLVLALTTLALVRLALEPAAGARWAAWLRSRPLAAVGTVAGTVTILALILSPYARAHRTHGPRQDSQVVLYAPRVSSWLAAPDGSLPSRVGFRSDPKRRAHWEHELFPGMVPLACGGLVLLAGWRGWGQWRATRRRRDRSAAALVVAALVVFAFSLYVPLRGIGPETPLREQGFTLWWWAWDWLPGAASIRAVGRIWSAVQLLLLIGGWLGAEALLRRQARHRWVAPLVHAAMILALGEQIRVGQPSFDKRELVQAVDAWRRAIPAHCQVVYFAFPKTATPPWVYQTRAMWAAFAAGIPTVNAYTSNYPPGYPPATQPASRAAVDAWVRQTNGTPACYIEMPGP